MRELITDLDKLSQHCLEINVVEEKDLLEEIIKELKDYAQAHKEIINLSANQLGYDKRVFVLKTKQTEDDCKFEVFINSMITGEDGLHAVIESDPCLPDREFLVARHDKIRVNYQTAYGAFKEQILKQENGADYIQHAVQMLDGVNISDFGLEIFDDFKEASEDEQAEVMKMYVDHLKAKEESIQAEIDADPDAKELQQAIKFINSAASGETKVQMKQEVMPLVGRKERRRLKRKGLLDALVDPITHRWKKLTEEGKIEN